MVDFMKLARDEAVQGLKNNDGGPFGAVIVRGGKVVASGHNEVVGTKDPTAHAEVTVIRKASKSLGRFDLSDCELYTSCEPCPMCLFAIHWARIPKVYFGCTRADAKAIGFDDDYLYEVMAGTASEQRVELVPQERETCLQAFELWTSKTDKVPY